MDHSDKVKPRHQETQEPVPLLEQLMRAKQKAEQAAIESEQHASELDAVFTAMGDSLVVYDSSGKTVSANPTALRLLGFNPVGMERHDLGKRVSLRHRRGELIGPEDLPSTQALRGQTVTSKYIVIRNALGRDVMTVCTATPIRRRGKVVGAVVILHDVSESWLVEKEKDDFVAMAGHELRTPISTVKAFAQILEKHFQHTNDQLAKMYVQKMGGQLERLTHLVNELLDATKIGAEKLELHKEKFNLEELLRESADDFQKISAKHTIIVKGKLQTKINADKNRIGQVLINLFSNAVKYSPKSDKIIAKVKESCECVVVEVQDYGIGIPEADQKKIFDRFFRVDNKKGKRFPGLGLGLNISAEIIKRHGGKIWVKSTYGKGSVFSFSLPFKSKLK